MINPDRTKPWDAMPHLPLSKELYLDEGIYRLLGDAKGKLGELKGTARLIENQGMLLNSISLREAQASTEIENIYTTDGELYAAFTNPEQVSGPAKEVLRYREAAWHGHALLKNKDTIALEDVIAVYRKVKDSSDGIRDPLRQTRILKSGSSLTSGAVVYTPPSNKAAVEGLLDNLLWYWNEDAEDPLLKMCLSHYQFEAIHPFSDGNGRTGRVLNVLYLSQKGYLELPILYLSRYILDNKDDYYHCLGGVSQRADWKAWVRFMLKAVLNSALSTLKLIDDIVGAESYVKAKIKRDAPNLYKDDLLKLMFRQPYITAGFLSKEGVGTEKTCRKYLDELSSPALGLLEKIEISGRVYYANKELAEVLSGSR